MSKISEYLKLVGDYYERQSQVQESQSVAEFAKDLHRPVEVVMEQLVTAGRPKRHQDDSISSEDKEALLDFLRKLDGTGHERKIVVLMCDSESVQLLRAVARQENGAELAALEYFTDQVVWGHPIDPDLQQLVNLVIAKSMVVGALPSMKKGRPQSDETERLGHEVAQRYWDMRDKGISYADAVQRLSEHVHKGERHIMRLVKEHTKLVGATLEQREANRRWWALMRDMRKEGDMPVMSSYEKVLQQRRELDPPVFETDDYIDHLDELIRKEADAKPLLTKKIRV